MTIRDRTKAVDEVARALVRPVVTVIFAVAFTLFTYLGLITGDVFASTAAMVLAFWFSSRNQEKEDAALVETVQYQQREMVDLAKQVPPPSVQR